MQYDVVKKDLAGIACSQVGSSRSRRKIYSSSTLLQGRNVAAVQSEHRKLAGRTKAGHSACVRSGVLQHFVWRGNLKQH